MIEKGGMVEERIKRDERGKVMGKKIMGEKKERSHRKFGWLTYFVIK